MITRNFYRLVWSYLAYLKPSALTSINGTAVASNRLPSGSSNRIQFGYDYTTVGWVPTLYAVRTVLNSYGGVILGTGTTPPTLDDYCLSGDLITTVIASASITRNETPDSQEITGLYTITNTGSDEITIGEIGLMVSTDGSNVGADCKVLCDRTVLDSPVTIPAGGVGQVTYTIRLPFPA